MQIIYRENVLEGVKDPVGYKAHLDAEIAAKPLRDWERAMAETDAKLPRYMEDLIDALGDTIKSKLPEIVLENYNTKKTKRAEKP